MTSTIPPFRKHPTKQAFHKGIHPHLLQFAQTRGIFNEHAAVNARNHNQAPRLPRANHLLLFSHVTHSYTWQQQMDTLPSITREKALGVQPNKRLALSQAFTIACYNRLNIPCPTVSERQTSDSDDHTAQTHARESPADGTTSRQVGNSGVDPCRGPNSRDKGRSRGNPCETREIHYRSWRLRERTHLRRCLGLAGSGAPGRLCRG